ncbi:hypothetical protein ACLETS_24015 [Enterobacter ludwigii]|uniref:hypothetical protein n=1 Tax=Enterobacter ludwigii TaxID=299767 RepID=UPI0039752F63
MKKTRYTEEQIAFALPAETAGSNLLIQSIASRAVLRGLSLCSYLKIHYSLHRQHDVNRSLERQLVMR